MCGIVAYQGKRQADQILIEGLKRLEYRGYDSAGLVVPDGEGLCLKRTVGRVANLQKMLDAPTGAATVGIAHTRWATHGAPTEANAHPHLDASGRIALVHNGIVENHTALKKWLQERGVSFASETDSEVIVQLIGWLYRQGPTAGDLPAAVRAALREIEGTYGLAILSAEKPDQLVVARRGSPIIIGVGEGEYIVASDASAIIEHTSGAVYLGDNEVAVLGPDGLKTTNLEDEPVSKDIEQLEMDLAQIELDGFGHFMAKEIFEQPASLTQTLRGRIDRRAGRIVLGGIEAMGRQLARTRRIIITACGTAWHAGLVGEFLLETLARIPTEVEYASEFRYRNPLIDEGTVVIAISQSGETADTLAALHEARQKGATTIGIVNVVGSTISRETDAGIYLHCGTEIGVASTRAFTSQLAVLTLLAMYLGRRRFMGQSELDRLLEELERLPQHLEKVLAQSEKIRQVTQHYAQRENWLFLGRGNLYPIALEGALKLKEVSYIHAEGLPAAEMKHGPIALINSGMPVVVLATRSGHYEKVLSNIEEVRARGGEIIAVATEGDEEIERLAEHVFTIPDVSDPLQPILAVTPLQLLAYHAALTRGCNVDKPRNLAKSVTVE